MGCCGRSRIEKPQQVIPALSVESAKLMASRKIGASLAPDERIQKRIESCRACPHFSKEICYRCGCRIVAKVAHAHEACPIRRW